MPTMSQSAPRGQRKLINDIAFLQRRWGQGGNRKAKVIFTNSKVNLKRGGFYKNNSI